jgi:starch synthase
MYNVLFPVSEAYPLIKTGGLGDVAGALPPALNALQCDVRLLLPAYQQVLENVESPKKILELYVPENDAHVRLLQTTVPGTSVIAWLVDHPASFRRPGNPYHDNNGHDWPDNAARFALLARVAAMIALGSTTLSWQPQVVHCHDWQTALAPALISLATRRPVTVFTIHNLAYQGLFDQRMLNALHLPADFWSPEGLEFHGHLSFIKGGLVYADHITTVSPNYANEIQTAEYGYGLQGLLRHRADRLTGILNGIDETVWNPATDRNIATNYDSGQLENKVKNKLALQAETGLAVAADIPLIGLVSRLVNQKGIDLVIGALHRLLAKQLPFQFVVLGTGDRVYERALSELALTYPKQIAATIGYDEVHAHRIEAGADMFLMPSRFEPCGLNQLYSLRYGTVPMVRGVGGLADTVIDASNAALATHTATGFVFHKETVNALVKTIERALALYKQRGTWQELALNGMKQDYSWRTSAEQYLHLYGSLVSTRT